MTDDSSEIDLEHSVVDGVSMGMNRIHPMLSFLGRPMGGRRRSLWAVLCFVLVSLPSARAQDRAESLPVDLPAPARDPASIAFEVDDFTMARVEYTARPGLPAPMANRWMTDWPAADVQLSSFVEAGLGLPANEPVSVALENPELGEYPFLYMVEGGSLRLGDEEAERLRDYLIRGGFLMVDDFWGEREWTPLAAEFRRVFPDREPVALGLDHEIFRRPYAIDGFPQPDNVSIAAAGQPSGERAAAGESRYWGILNDDGRLMVVFCQNADFGDAWEHANLAAYPRDMLRPAIMMGLNIVAYALSH